MARKSTSSTVTGGVRIEGLSKLAKELESVGVNIDDLGQAFGQIAREAADEMRKHIPRRSGNLANTIKPGRSKNRAVVSVGSKRVPYAAPINYGWPKRNIAPAGFIEATDEAMRDRAVSTIEQAIKKLLAQKGLS